MPLKKTARAIAFYLPQYHPIPENNEWWGPGFTEWTNVAKAKPLFRGHRQPKIPADLGFYDLRVPETRAAQADMARAAGIEGFCYWHYWFAGRRLLERPFNEVLASGEPDFPFCLGWANHSWTGVWYGAPDQKLIEQTYPGEEDYRRHFHECLLPAFSDHRYLCVDGKPLLLVFQPLELPENHHVLDLWRSMSEKAGLGGLHAVAHAGGQEDGAEAIRRGFDAVTIANLKPLFASRAVPWTQLIRRRMTRYPVMRDIAGVGRRPIHVLPYATACDDLVVQQSLDYEYYPCVIPNWDNTARSGSRGSVLTGSTPQAYQRHLRQAVDRVGDLSPGHRIIFIKSWNEWAEGNYLEPDQEFGQGYLNATQAVLKPAAAASSVRC